MIRQVLQLVPSALSSFSRKVLRAATDTAWRALVGVEGFYARNLIINGGMNLDQRNEGAAKTFTAAAALAYCVDVWYGYCTGANVSGQRVAGTGNRRHLYRFTGAASVTAIGFGHRMEQRDTYHAAGQNAVLSVDLANSLLTTVTWTAYYANTADTFGTLGAPTRTQIATGSFTVNATMTRYSAPIAIPAAATTGIEVVLTVGAQTSGTWDIGDVQLELGSVATPFERVSNRVLQAQCDRTYCKTFVTGTAPAQNAGVAGSLYHKVPIANGCVQNIWNFPVRMRAAPTITTYSPGDATDRWWNTSAGGNSANSSTSINESRAHFATATGLTVGELWSIHAHAECPL